jgi:hypothetical protein
LPPAPALRFPLDDQHRAILIDALLIAVVSVYGAGKLRFGAAGPAGLRHPGAIATKDLSELTDEDLLKIIGTIATDVLSDKLLEHDESLNGGALPVPVR